MEINTEKIFFNLVTDRSRYLLYFLFIVSIVFDERNYWDSPIAYENFLWIFKGMDNI